MKFRSRVIAPTLFWLAIACAGVASAISTGARLDAADPATSGQAAGEGSIGGEETLQAPARPDGAHAVPPRSTETSSGPGAEASYIPVPEPNVSILISLGLLLLAGTRAGDQTKGPSTSPSTRE